MPVEGYPPYVDIAKIKDMDDLPQKAAVYILRLTNKFRAKGEVGEFIDYVLNINLDLVLKTFPGVIDIIEELRPELKDELEEKKRRLKIIPIGKPIEIGAIYQIFSTFVDYLFIMYDRANYFGNEPEVINLVGKTVFDLYLRELDPNEIKTLSQLTKNDAIRLVRAINSFRRKDMVDRFLSEIGDFENIYDLFQLYVGYLFHEYENADYFLNEPELDFRMKEFQTKEFGNPTKFEGEFD